MQTNRKKTRRFLLQKLYARIYGEVNDELFLGSFFTGILDFDIDDAYFDEIFAIVVEHQDEFLNIISKYAPKFEIETMLKTNILAMCIALAEMLYFKEEIPAKVSINEAIELSKYFWDENQKRIVNGILHNFYKNFESYSKEKITHQAHHFFS